MYFLIAAFYYFFSPNAHAGSLREVVDQNGTVYKIDIESHRIYTQIIVDGKQVWVGSDRVVRSNAEFPPVILSTPTKPQSVPHQPTPQTRSNQTQYPLPSAYPVYKPQEYSPSMQLTSQQAAQIIDAVNQVFGPGISVHDHSALRAQANQHTTNAAKNYEEIERLKKHTPPPLSVELPEITEEDIARSRQKIILDIPSIPDPEAGSLPYSFKSDGEQRQDLEKLYKNLYKISPVTEKRQTARTLGLFSVEEADLSYSIGNTEEGDAFKEIAVGFLDLAIGLDPVTSIARSSIELMIGRNFVTGAKFSEWDYTFAALNLGTFGLGCSAKTVFKVFGKVVQKLPNLVSSTKKIESAIVAAEKMFESSARIEQFGPLKKGALHFITEGAGTVADTFRSSSYIEIVTKEPVQLYRAYATDSRQISTYWSRIKPTGPYQAVLDSALDPAWNNTATKWIEITVPSGEQLYEGIVSEIALKIFNNPTPVGRLLGGGNQIYINKRVPSTWITNGGSF